LNRTLSEVGEKQISVCVTSSSALTHSYTIQPIISLSCEIVGPLLICLQEPGGKFGPIVEKNLFRPSNVVVTCTKSGKLTKDIVKKLWSDKILFPSIRMKSLILLDSWSGHNKQSIYSDPEGGDKTCDLLVIPPKTTSIAQPLDCYYFGQHKDIARKMYERVSLDNININLREINNIIKMKSLIINQLSAEIFKPMIRYSWFASGYLQSHPGQFKNVKEVCFQFACEACTVCANSAFICCSWCREFLCFQCFYIQYHTHDV